MTYTVLSGTLNPSIPYPLTMFNGSSCGRPVRDRA